MGLGKYFLDSACHGSQGDAGGLGAVCAAAGEPVPPTAGDVPQVTVVWQWWPQRCAAALTPAAAALG